MIIVSDILKYFAILKGLFSIVVSGQIFFKKSVHLVTLRLQPLHHKYLSPLNGIDFAFQNGTLQHVILSPDPLASHHTQGPPPPPTGGPFVPAAINPYVSCFLLPIHRLLNQK